MDSAFARALRGGIKGVVMVLDHEVQPLTRALIYFILFWWHATLGAPGQLSFFLDTLKKSPIISCRLKPRIGVVICLTREPSSPR